MELCENGELFNHIVELDRLSEDESSYFFFQLINGIEYIHSKGIAHRDLKPENLLISKNKILKIIDFGLSNFYDGQKRLQTPCGSPCYASPEMVKGKKYDGFNIDIWAIGVILFAMLCGYLPFEDDENDTDVLFNEIIRNKIDYPYFLSDLSLDILQRILVSDPLKRITIDEIKNHEFYLKGERIFRNKFEEIKRENKEMSKNITNLVNSTYNNIKANLGYILDCDIFNKYKIEIGGLLIAPVDKNAILNFDFGVSNNTNSNVAYTQVISNGMVNPEKKFV